MVRIYWHRCRRCNIKKYTVVVIFEVLGGKACSRNIKVIPCTWRKFGESGKWGWKTWKNINYLFVFLFLDYTLKNDLIKSIDLVGCIVNWWILCLRGGVTRGEGCVLTLVVHRSVVSMELKEWNEKKWNSAIYLIPKNQQSSI